MGTMFKMYLNRCVFASQIGNYFAGFGKRTPFMWKSLSFTQLHNSQKIRSNLAFCILLTQRAVEPVSNLLSPDFHGIMENRNNGYVPDQTREFKCLRWCWCGEIPGYTLMFHLYIIQICVIYLEPIYSWEVAVFQPMPKLKCLQEFSNNR